MADLVSQEQLQPRRIRQEGMGCPEEQEEMSGCIL